MENVGWSKDTAEAAIEISYGGFQIVIALLALWLAWKVLGWPLRKWSERQREFQEEQDQLHGSSRHATRADLEKAGMTTMQAESSNDSGSSYSRTGRPLFMPDEIRRIDRVNQLLFVQGMHPCMVGKAFYYDMSEFKGMYDPNPYREG